MSATATALKRLYTRTSQQNQNYRKVIGAVTGKYGKLAKDVFDRSIQRQNRLIEIREAEEAVLQRDRESFHLATRDVLSKDTLDYLKSLSNIAAPTLTSVFTGYESARADEAAREERLLDKREDTIKRLQDDRQTIFREAGANDRQRLAAEGRILGETTSAAGRLLSEGNQTERAIANDIVSADQANIQRGFSQEERLQRERFNSQERLEGQRFSQAQQEDRQAQSTAERAATQAFNLSMTNAKSAEERQQIQLRHNARLAEIRESGKYSRSSSSTAKRGGISVGAIVSAANKYKAEQATSQTQSANPNQTPIDAPYVIDKMQKLGFSRNQAIGIAANIKGESDFNPSASGDGGKAFGLAQWHPDRQQEFERVFSKPIQESTSDEQLEFIAYEMFKGNEKRAGEMMRKAMSPREAAAAMVQYYERPADIPGESERRGLFAEEFDAKFPDITQEPAKVEPLVNDPAPAPTPAPIEPEPERPDVPAVEIGPAAALDDTGERVAQMQSTIDQFADQEDTLEAMRLATQEKLQADEQVREQLASISENPTIDEMEALIQERNDDDEAKQLIAATRFYQSILDQKVVS